MRIAILTPGPDYKEDWSWAYDSERKWLESAGAHVDPIQWNSGTDLSPFDLILPLIAWGYHLDFSRWLRFLDDAERSGLPLINPPTLLRWNSNKVYLAELCDRNVPTVPTLSVDACCEADLEQARRQFETDWLVIKPPISASATGTHRVGPKDDLPHSSRGKATIIQPLIKEIERTGEFSLMMFDGEFSHAVVKRPKTGDFRVQAHLGGTTNPSAPPPGGIALARQALDAAPSPASYARIDVVPDDQGRLKIMELELIEPALFLDESEKGGEMFVNAVLSAAERAIV